MKKDRTAYLVENYTVDELLEAIKRKYDAATTALAQANEQNKSNTTFVDSTIEMALKDNMISQRTFNCLRRGGLTTLADIQKTSLAELETIRGLGKIGLAEISRWVNESGGSFSDNRVILARKLAELNNNLAVRNELLSRFEIPDWHSSIYVRAWKNIVSLLEAIGEKDPEAFLKLEGFEAP